MLRVDVITVEGMPLFQRPGIHVSVLLLKKIVPVALQSVQTIRCYHRVIINIFIL